LDPLPLATGRAATPEAEPRTRGSSDPTPPTVLLLDWSASELDIACSRRTEIFPDSIILTHSPSVKTDVSTAHFLGRGKNEAEDR